MSRGIILPVLASILILGIFGFSEDVFAESSPPSPPSSSSPPSSPPVSSLPESIVFLTKWGSPGDAINQFNFPFGIAVDLDGFVYVADTNNERIVKFTSDGAFLTEWGSPDGQFINPYGIAVDLDGNVYVVDTNNGRILKFTSDGAFLTKWRHTVAPDTLSFPHGIAVDLDGNVYVADTSNNRIVKFTSDGAFLKEWGAGGPTADGDFFSPSGIAVDLDGNVYVADTKNNRIQKFTSDGAFLTKWRHTVALDTLSFPRSIAAMHTSLGEMIYVADTGNNRIVKFTSDGAFLKEWGSQGSANGQFINSRGIAVDLDGNVYVADSGNDRIQKFYDKDFREKFTEEEFTDKEKGPFMVTTTDSAMGDGTHIYLEFSEIHVNYEITATQNGETILQETAHAMEMIGENYHIDAVGSDDNPIDIEIVSLGIGLPNDEDNWTGPTGTVATTQVVPEFGTIAMMVLAVAIISIVAVTAKSRVIPRL